MDPTNVLVTGGAGFIGSNFVRHLLESEPNARIVNLDALTYAGSLENLLELPDSGRHRFVRGDICDGGTVRRLLRLHRIDTIVHFAAETHVDRSILAPGLFVRTNVMGTVTLLTEAEKYWLKDRSLGDREVRFHHVSTDEVFGSLAPDEPAWKETVPYAPHSPYAASKAAADHLVRSFGYTHGLPFTITNCSNNYGPYQFPEKLIPLVICNAMEGKPLPVYGDGRQVRDWLYVEDHCDAIRTVLKRGRPGQTYNVGGGEQPTNLAIIRGLCALLDGFRRDSPHVPHDRLIRFVTDRPGHDRRYAMDIAKIRQELEWKPRHSLEDGLEGTVRWYLDHGAWLAEIRRRPGFQEWIKTNYSERDRQRPGARKAAPHRRPTRGKKGRS